MSQRTILIWFRNDLRIHDNEILFEAVKKSSSVVPVYCFDPRYFVKSEYGTIKTGYIRAKFILESVADLKQSVQELGGDLLVLTGKPEELLPEIAKKYKVTEVYHHREVAFEETEISAAVEAALWKQQINLKHFIGHTLYHKEELPFPIKDIPDVFATFRKKIERDSKIRPGFGIPEKVVVPTDLESSGLPDLARLAVEPAPNELPDTCFKGGETEGLKHLGAYLLESGMARGTKNSKAGTVAPYSSRLSPWIALGCLSVRKVYWEIKAYERGHGPSDASNALINELLWRDYFRFMFKKYGSKYFTEKGADQGRPDTNPGNQALFDLWKAGKTGQSDVDASMRSLNTTGYITNGERYETANYLVKVLNINWIWGAAYFEEKLVDYSPASNWGSWAHIAGVINTPPK